MRAEGWDVAWRRGAPARAFNLYGNGRAGNLARPGVTSGGAESHLGGLRRATVADEGHRDGTSQARRTG